MTNHLLEHNLRQLLGYVLGCSHAAYTQYMVQSKSKNKFGEEIVPMALVDLANWSFIPGPLANPPPSSVALHDIIEYPPEVVADAILAFPGMRLLHSAKPTWWQWVARWDCENRWIEVGFTLFDTEPLAWGGSGLRGRCQFLDILALWSTLRERVAASWMHNTDCEIHSPESFTAWIQSAHAEEN